MEVNIYPHPNPAITAVLRSEQLRAILAEIAEKAHVLYVAQVAKRTGALAASAQASTEIGGVQHDRWIGVLTVGGSVEYAASHEFGTGDHPGSIHQLDSPFGDGIQAGAHDLNRVLEELGGL